MLFRIWPHHLVRIGRADFAFDAENAISLEPIVAQLNAHHGLGAILVRQFSGIETRNDCQPSS